MVRSVTGLQRLQGRRGKLEYGTVEVNFAPFFTSVWGVSAGVDPQQCDDSNCPIIF